MKILVLLLLASAGLAGCAGVPLGPVDHECHVNPQRSWGSGCEDYPWPRGAGDAVPRIIAASVIAEGEGASPPLPAPPACKPPRRNLAATGE
jgi:hypothetical protein